MSRLGFVNDCNLHREIEMSTTKKIPMVMVSTGGIRKMVSIEQFLEENGLPLREKTFMRSTPPGTLIEVQVSPFTKAVRVDLHLETEEPA